MKSLAVILGSAFKNSIPDKLGLQPIEVDTRWGQQTIYGGTADNGRKIYALIRHGSPHHLLPHQINYRAQAAALKAVNCGALVINSSVGVLTEELPLYQPLLLTDQLMPENRLPDGSTCSMFQEPTEQQGHLVLNEGLFSEALNDQLYNRHSDSICQADNVVFVYAGGPRSKTPAENRMWAQLGGHVNSMTVAPEVVLANELEIPVAGLVVGHKYSMPDIENPPEEEIRETLVKARTATKDILVDFLEHGKPVAFGNHIYRY
ncbi:MTAP family purine nucleoside phosphorylase [Fodinibius halophilus]|uniref:MTAP family purine nucleoside phosphorylase n=1 Tax=Fodinibius halophilus TaxID=1736908 RepID=A0A6M1SY43_9BACT|nr:MTAP family purine nucleoside phosphorylase [Fodinibius halophilus]NGP88818.1 MTAP family purine nucleoside phosphorylase [Fodinibius halophilus]